MRTQTLCLLALLVTTPAWAQKDSIRTGAAIAPTIRASENTVISYTGTVPATFTGALDADDSTYNRATTCAALSSVGTAAPFDTIVITNNSPGTANVIIFSSLIGGGVCGDANDTFFTLYNGAFNPASALTNCVAVNDDIAAAANRCSQLTFSIPVGETRTVVAAGFNNATDPDGLFGYQIQFTGTTPVELIDFSVD
ncbi:MAG TPA: hypothetical protein VGS22_02475 [Thermoanaerobaculia bacterium]|jgi:hypothetical protein|nr:hypothetical protein [Thermoanaerobaculia bacterium]